MDNLAQELKTIYHIKLLQIELYANKPSKDRVEEILLHIEQLSEKIPEWVGQVSLHGGLIKKRVEEKVSQGMEDLDIFLTEVMEARISTQNLVGNILKDWRKVKEFGWLK